MKKAVVVGGSNGIGLAIANELIKRGYFAVILDKNQVAPDSLPEGQFEFIYCNLLAFQDSIFESLALDPEIDFLMITAGFGRVAEFEYLHVSEIQNIIQVNTIAGIKIIRFFYDRISSKEKFYCGMMASIAGLMSSPLFSVYAASKAALCRFIESINIELEVKGTGNRILNVSPSSIPGTRFNGGANELSKIESLAEEITNRIFKGEELFIPKYEETFKDVLERYRRDPHEYGLHSYHYKMDSGRIFNERRVKIGFISDSFDQMTVDFLISMKEIREKCDYLMVMIRTGSSSNHSDGKENLQKKKDLLDSCRYVDCILDSGLSDQEVWEKYKYNFICLSEESMKDQAFDEMYFKDREIEIIRL